MAFALARFGEKNGHNNECGGVHKVFNQSAHAIPLQFVIDWRAGCGGIPLKQI